MNAMLSLAGRVGLSLIFIISGWGKIAGYAVLELGGGLAILAGLWSRWIAIALAGFSIVSALVFHADFGDQMQAINFWKNVAMAGGFLFLAANGPGALSLDARFGRSRVTTAG